MVPVFEDFKVLFMPSIKLKLGLIHQQIRMPDDSGIDSDEPTFCIAHARLLLGWAVFSLSVPER